ncbi:MAG: DUF2587 domain-containing protein [Acidimicrobiia bacterium]|nr:DUF2587 domain-containing protein [Acidimicrobiia bacterium]
MTTPEENNEAAERPKELPLQAQVVEEEDPEAPQEDSGSFITEPSKLIRIASMTRAMLDEVRQAPLDELGRRRLGEIYTNSLDQLRESLSDDLQEELESIFQPLHQEETSESELRIVQAQLVGWLEGLFHGIQASLFSQQAAAAAQLDEMRRRRALEAASEEPGRSPGQYL